MAEVSGDGALVRLEALRAQLNELLALDPLAVVPVALQAEIDAAVRDAVAVLCPGVIPEVTNGPADASTPSPTPRPTRCSDLLLSVELLRGAVAENEQ